VWERFLSRWFYQDCAWWQSSLSCWLVEAGRIFFGTTSKLIRELAYRLGKRLDDRKVYHLFPRYMFNDRVWSFVHVQYETSRRLRNDRQ
jgi:hypothetical protein